MSRTTVTGPTVGSAPICLGEPLGPETVMQGGARVDAAQFPRLDRVMITSVAAALINATSITTNALSGPIPAGKTLTLTGGKLAKLRLSAIAGQTVLYTEPLPQALAGTETGEYSGSGKIHILTGTPIGRTIAERNAQAPFGPAVNTDDEIFLTAREIRDASDIDEVTLYRPGRIVYENFLPGVGSYAGALLTRLRAIYHMQLGA